MPPPRRWRPGANISTVSTQAACEDPLTSNRVTRIFEIVNEKGLHARASAKFVECVEEHDATAEVLRDGMSASGDSIMGLLMLAASKGTAIEVSTHGPEALKLADALERLVATRFGEDM
ncbi:HPr family phosphocarrier protein [Rhodovulum sulfidophilum]|uniref:HPr family phosphocarrier protein n=1 Tax=Rhodovulum sulfidophilum TaxID=35806 RepID=A0ABS1RZJ6_RHOSU|nr:HPr family phosphocarrier protein [Rhodovulum sulfidophilum]MBL3565688.1 HPr family phosphocarrier protein [Rhodovulum sulfidophilum]MBL3572920.1 HPr family phosphocarrier protein [Rhodovulum sulfidophilum]MBL3610505.1 HPr family phosphocarrier protein [Rhodovulum sulfidophilum]NDK35935.1 HPr family phosphocarrier protein [Rhodovulum sulfidophilum]